MTRVNFNKTKLMVYFYCMHAQGYAHTRLRERKKYHNIQ